MQEEKRKQIQGCFCWRQLPWKLKLASHPRSLPTITPKSKNTWNHTLSHLKNNPKRHFVYGAYFSSRTRCKIYIIQERRPPPPQKRSRRLFFISFLHVAGFISHKMLACTHAAKVDLWLASRAPLRWECCMCGCEVTRAAKKLGTHRTNRCFFLI